MGTDVRTPNTFISRSRQHGRTTTTTTIGPRWPHRRLSGIVVRRTRWCESLLALFAVGLCSGILTLGFVLNSPLILYSGRKHSAGNQCLKGVIKDCLLKVLGFQLDVPLHMQKDPSTTKGSTKANVCFVHVGKTAGTTVQCLLGFLEKDCFASKKHPKTPIAPGFLPLSTTHKIHNEWNGCRHQHFDYYLFVVRNPLTRMQSWFTYERPTPDRTHTRDRIPYQARLFNDCRFHTLNDLGMYGLDPDDAHNEIFGSFVNDLIPSDDELQVMGQPNFQRRANLCQDRAKMAIQGLVGYWIHNRYNYEYYLREVEQYHPPKNVSIVVVRTEYIHQDWTSIEENILNGPKHLDIALTRKNASTKNGGDMYLSDVAQRRICMELCQEIQTYKQILQRAVNLSPLDVAQSMRDMAESCPVETASQTCPNTNTIDQNVRS